MPCKVFVYGLVYRDARMHLRICKRTRRRMLSTPHGLWPAELCSNVDLTDCRLLLSSDGVREFVFPPHSDGIRSPLFHVFILTLMHLQC